MSLRVLIIDDSENDALLIIRELKKGGYSPVYERVETAASMEKSLKDEIWDIILCDYKMPKFNAPSAIALLKTNNIDTPVIIISGVTGEETAVECMRSGARDYIMKDNLYRLCPAIARELTEAKNRKKQKKKEEDKRKKIGEALRKSELSFRSLFEVSPVGIFKVADRKFLQVNPALCRTTGYSPEDLIGQSVRICYRNDEEYEQAGKILYGQVLQNGKKFVEAHFKHKNGAEFDALLYLNLIDPRDYYAGYEGILMDVTKLKRTERKLLENEERLRGITQNLPGIIFQFYAKDNGEYGLSYISEPLDEFSKIIVGDDAANLDTSFSSFVSRVYEEDRDRFLASIKTAVETVTPWNFEGRIALQSGMMVWFQGLSIPTCYEDRLVFNGILLNITERKLAEEKSRQSEEKFRNIFMIAPDCIVISRLKDGLLMDVNKGFEDITGWKREIVIGKETAKPPLNLWVDLSEREFMTAELNTRRDVLHRQFEFRRRDGSIRTGIYSARSININNEECLIFILQDITEQKKAENELKLFAENLEDANIALRVLMNCRDKDEKEFEEKLQININDLVIPYLKKLKMGNLDDRNKNYVSVLENNLSDVLSPFMRDIRSSHKNLTPQEIQIVDLIRQGKNTKEIANMLNASVNTIATHRNNLRKKLNLRNSKINLRSHILS
jgi:PAS domain S-box-containing protein